MFLDEARESSYLFTGFNSELSCVLKDSPKLLLFARNLCDNPAQLKNRQRLLQLHTLMKRIACHAEIFADETKKLNIDTLPGQLRKALDVANLTKLQLDAMLNIKPLSYNRKLQLRNAEQRQLIRVGSSR